MGKTLIICEGTQGGTDKKLLHSLITEHVLLPAGTYRIHTTDIPNTKFGSIDDVMEFLANQLLNFATTTTGGYSQVLIIVDARSKSSTEI